MEVETVDDVIAEATGDGGTGVAPAGESSSTGDRTKKRSRRRTNSKEDKVINAVNLAPRTWKNSRRPRNRYGRGLPKKGGAGGKGVWGAPGSELLEAYEDQNDPNYDSESLSNGDIKLKEVIPEVDEAQIRKKTQIIILEYFEHGESHEVALALDDFITSAQCYLVVRIAIEIALDHKSSHREMISRLISDLYGEPYYILAENDLSKAFNGMLDDLPDLMLDTPDAAHVLGNFIARAIADDCLPPKYVYAYRDTPPANDPAIEAIKRADTLLSMEHGLVRLDNVWGVGGGLRPVKSLTRQMTLLLKEYLSSNDIDEAIRCLNLLEVPHFHHELVYEAVLSAIEEPKDVIVDAITKLLKVMSDAAIIAPAQLEQGFKRVFDDMQDIVLDVPLAYTNLDTFMAKCAAAKFLTADITACVPTADNRGRKRYVSQGDGGQLKPDASSV